MTFPLPALSQRKPGQGSFAATASPATYQGKLLCNPRDFAGRQAGWQAALPILGQRAQSTAKSQQGFGERGGHGTCKCRIKRTDRPHAASHPPSQPFGTTSSEDWELQVSTISPANGCLLAGQQGPAASVEGGTALAGCRAGSGNRVP